MLKYNTLSAIEGMKSPSYLGNAGLEDWEPPGETDQSPDPLISITMDGERLEVPASTPTEAERDEVLKQALHQRLRDKVKALAVAAGNRFNKLAAQARSVEMQVEVEFRDLNLLMLHLEVDDLREMEALGREDEESGAFPAEVLIPLRDVLRIAPGLTLGHPDVDQLVERSNRRRIAPPVPEAELAAQDAMSLSMAEDIAAIGDNLRALQKIVAQSGSPEDREVQKAANRSVLWRLAVGVWGVTVAMGTTVLKTTVTELLSAPLVAYVKANLPILTEAAKTYGVQFFEWFMMNVRHWLP